MYIVSLAAPCYAHVTYGPFKSPAAVADWGAELPGIVKQANEQNLTPRNLLGYASLHAKSSGGTVRVGGFHIRYEAAS